MAHESFETFDAVKSRLDEIVELVGSDELPLDEALALYEEAVGLGLRASDLLEKNIEERDLQEETSDEQDGAVLEDESREVEGYEGSPLVELSASDVNTDGVADEPAITVETGDGRSLRDNADALSTS